MSSPGAKQGARQRIKPLRASDRNQDGTRTARGFIPHLNHNGLQCPVKLITRKLAGGNVLDTDLKGLGYPMLRQGAHVFALPGGYSICKGRADA